MNDLTESDDVLERAIEFASSKYFTGAVESFQTLHAHSFAKLNETKECEYDLSYTAIFNEYQSLLDELFEEFGKSIGVSNKTIYGQCRDVGKELILFNPVRPLNSPTPCHQLMESLRRYLKSIEISGLWIC